MPLQLFKRLDILLPKILHKHKRCPIFPCRYQPSQLTSQTYIHTTFKPGCLRKFYSPFFSGHTVKHSFYLNPSHVQTSNSYMMPSSSIWTLWSCPTVMYTACMPLRANKAIRLFDCFTSYLNFSFFKLSLTKPCQGCPKNKKKKTTKEAKFTSTQLNSNSSKLCCGFLLWT